MSDAERRNEEKQLIDSYDTSLEFFGKFLLSPDINEFNHLDKNLATTNLDSGRGEPEKARTILESLHILNRYKTKATKKIAKRDAKGFPLKERVELLDSDGNLVEVRHVPVYDEVTFVEYTYPLTVRYFLSLFYSLVGTTASTDGHLLKTFKTHGILREETVEDKTESQKKYGLFNKKKSGGQMGQPQMY